MSLTSAFKLSTARNPGKTAIAFDEDSWSFSEFDRLSSNIAQNLLIAGAEPGDRIALHLLNGPEAALASVGCLKAGFVVVPVNTRLKGREIDYILRHSGSAFYIAQPELYENVADACSSFTGLNRRYLTEPATRDALPFSALIQNPARSVSLAEVPAGQTAALLYTSGTTANPKGVMHSHGTLLETARAMCHMQLDEDQTVLLLSSMAHMVGFCMVFLSALVNGATTVITQPFDFESSLDAHSRWRCTYTMALPVMFQSLLKLQMQAPRDVSSGRFFFCGGDSVSAALQEAFRMHFKPVCEAYGATEIAPSCWNRPKEVRIGSIGRPAPGIEFRLVNADGSQAQPGAVGEICIRGPHLAIGYWQDPEATRAAMHDGWFRSGDLATRDADGFYWFAGRKKEVIVRGGSNISPQQIEAALYEHPAIAEIGVVGKRDPIWGETVVAHVVPRPGYRLDEAEVIAFARERLADYKVPGTVIFHSELPKGPTGKIQRRALREAEDALATVS